jgi:hypothetical protein
VDVESLALRVRAEFLEMPGLRLTLSQAQRLWALDRDVCIRVVDVLVSRSVLRRAGEAIMLASSHHHWHPDAPPRASDPHS